MIWVSLTLCVLILLFCAGFFLRKTYKKTGTGLLIATVLLSVFFVGGTALCWSAPNDGADAEADFGLVLGYGLHHGQAAPELVRRCEAGLAWMEEHPKQYLIVSGGDPTNQGVTEAAVMAAWLRNHGADAEWILLEDQAADTRENLLFSQALAEEHGLGTDRVTIITSDYHQTRARFLAERQGMAAQSLSAHTPFLRHLTSAVREVYAVVSEILGL